MEAARKAGARRFVAQSFGNWNYERAGTATKTEDDPLDPNRRPRCGRASPRSGMSNPLSSAGLALPTACRAWSCATPTCTARERRGPKGGAFADLVRQRKLPLIGGGEGIWSFVHIDDMAIATVAGIERAAPGIYNIADDEPAPVRVWLPFVANVLGAKPPLACPRVDRTVRGGVGLDLHLHQDPRSIECQGQARARLAADVSELA